jgi:hypothetical protein
MAGAEKLMRREEMQGHCYYEAMHWESSRQLTIRVFGRTEEVPSREFTYYFCVDVPSGETKLLKKEDREPE